MAITAKKAVVMQKLFPCSPPGIHNVYISLEICFANGSEPLWQGQALSPAFPAVVSLSKHEGC